MNTSLANTPFYTGAQCQALDRQACADLGLDSMVLMRRAGQALYELLLQQFPRVRELVICCGTGNNAGDGYVLANLALQAGMRVLVLQVDGRELAGDAGLAQQEFTQSLAAPTAPGTGSSVVPITSPELGDLNEPVAESAGARVYVDALLGTGSYGAPRATTTALIRMLNQVTAPVLAVDIPSGLDAGLTGGWAAEQVVRADVTLSFLGRKLCLHTGAGVDVVGDLHYATLGTPPATFTKIDGVPALAFDPQQIPKPEPGTYKHRQGKVVVVGGDLGMGGAIALTAQAALASGAGIVQVITQGEHLAPILARAPELMVTSAADWPKCELLLAEADVVAIGPGLGRTAWGRNLYTLVQQVVDPTRTLTIFDADALFLLAEAVTAKHPGKDPFAQSPPSRVITPHSGEAARLLGLTGADVQRDRTAAVQQLAAQTGSVAILKGPGSLIGAPVLDPENPTFTGHCHGLCTTGNPAMATAGMGDVLTGVLAGLLALSAQSATQSSTQNSLLNSLATAGGDQPHQPSLVDVAGHAMCWHGAAADYHVARVGTLTAADVIDALPAVLRDSGVRHSLAQPSQQSEPMS